MEIVYSPTADKHLEIIKKSGSPATKKDRVVYRVDGDDVNVFSLLGHYDDK